MAIGEERDLQEYSDDCCLILLTDRRLGGGKVELGASLKDLHVSHRSEIESIDIAALHDREFLSSWGYNRL